MTYKGTSLNKVIKSFVIGGGELENYTGKEKCVYGQYFDDENYIYGHCRRGLLTMDNDGKNTNNSKFLITLKYIPWFDGKHVVFGQIIKGLDVLKEIENLETDNDDKPFVKVIIENCGEIIRTEIVKPVEDKKEEIEEIVENNENKNEKINEKEKKENEGENKEKEIQKNVIENSENKTEKIDTKNVKEENNNNDLGNIPQIDTNKKMDNTNYEKIIEKEINLNKIEKKEKEEQEEKKEKKEKEEKDLQHDNKTKEIENINMEEKKINKKTNS